jgi:hypothetical protein
MKKIIMYILVLILVAVFTSGIALAGGGNERGEKGEGDVNQVQNVENIEGFGPFTNFDD